MRVERRDDPTIIEPTDAVIRLSATCICGSDLWPYRGVEAVGGATPMGHEYCGIVEEVGSAITTVRPGQVSDLTLPLDQAAEAYRAMDERRAIKTLLTF